MARKIRFKNKSTPKTSRFEVQDYIAREIAAIFYISLAVLTWLSLRDQLGVVGDFWASAIRPVFGYGVYAVPVVLVLMGISVFFSKKMDWGLSQVTGLFLMAVSILGFVHIQYPADQLLAVARGGAGGGYIGFVSSFIFLTAFGTTGAHIVFFSVFLIGLLLALQISLKTILHFIATLPEQFQKLIALLKGEHRPISSEEEESIQAPLALEAPTQEKRKGALDRYTLKQVTPQEVQIRLLEEQGKGEVISMNQQNLREDTWEYPPLDLLDGNRDTFKVNEGDLRRKASQIQGKLQQFGIEVDMKEVHVGPTVVQYTLKPSEGVKLSKITSLKNDLALALAAEAIRIEAPIPGKSLVGIEIPNRSRATVRLREVMESPVYQSVGSPLRLALGRDVSGNPMVENLEKLPHLLIAGATGSGKSVAMNGFLLSLLYNNSPRELRFIMIDPKQVELSGYNGLPHLLTPVITEPDKAATALRWAVAEMNRRYKVCAEAGHRNINDYNKDKKVAEKMPKIVIVIDELADLMMVAQKEVEASICRLAQMARAVGMHLMVATQRPSVDVITGLIKANIPARIAFTVASSVDSRTILDTIGAEDLLGAGDMLYLSGTMGKPVRIQGIYVSSAEIERVTNRLKLTRDPDYDEQVTSKQTATHSVQGIPEPVADAQSDEDLLRLALECLRKNRKAASTSSMQRYLRIGYARAARIMDLLEEKGIVGPSQGSRPREVFLKEE